MKRTVMIICLGVFTSVLAVPPSTRRDLEAQRANAGAVELSGSKEVEAFFDPFFTKHVAESRYPGAAVVLVKDGHILFEKGYGYTDSEKTKPVSADHTVFYAASVSKLFVATAIMQLAEQGKLNLNDDVNKYLRGFQLGNEFLKPVTVANLLTHTGGLDDHMLGAEIPITSPPMPLGEYFARYTPPRVLPPGDQINYSNHGMALAGYIVEVVSGMPFYEYVEKNIFAPLGMKHSSFRQPVPRDLATDIGLERFPKPQTIPYPVATLVSTPEDMGRFMLAHLNGGRLGEGRILQEASVTEMQRQHFTNHPHMPGVAYGFFESFANDQRALFHTGARDHFSILYLLPELKVGLYIVMSATEDESGLGPRVLKAFLDHYYPAQEKVSPLNSSADNGQPADRFAGLYRMNMIPHNTIGRLAAMALDVQVTALGTGTLTLNIPGHGGRDITLLQVEPLLFRTDGGGYVAFGEDEKGRVANMFLSGLVGDNLFDPTSFDKLRWHESGKLHATLAAVGFLVFLLFPFITLGMHIFGRRKKSQHERRLPRLARISWRVAIIVSVLVILSPVSGIIMALLTTEHQLYSIPPILYVALSFLQLAALLGLGLPVFAVFAWRRRYWSLGARLLFSSVALVAFCMIPFMNYWNLLGFRF
jgi:CubicO group peptidase (beta-lactamase class C family)